MNGQALPIGSSDAAASSDKPPRGRKPGSGGIEKEIKEIEAGFDGIFQSMANAAAMSYFLGNEHAAEDASDIWDNQLKDDKHTMTQALCRASRQNSNLRKALLSVVHVSAYGDIAMALIAMISPIVMRHMGFTIPNMTQEPAYANNGN